MDLSRYEDSEDSEVVDAALTILIWNLRETQQRLSHDPIKVAELETRVKRWQPILRAIRDARRAEGSIT